MKKSFLLYLIMSVFLIGYCACDNDEENFDTATYRTSDQSPG